MAKRESKLFPNKKKRPDNDSLKNTKDFSDYLENKKKQDPTEPDTGEIEKQSNTITEIEIEQTPVTRIQKEERKLENPNKSHKGIAGRKAEYSDPRLKKDKNAKISLSTKVRIERLISRKYDNKSVGDIIDMALDNLVSTFDRDDRDSLFEAYKEDMELIKPIVQAENEKLKAAGKRYIELTDEVDQETLRNQKNSWVNSKFD